MGLCWFSEQTAIISLNSNKQLIFVMITIRVLFEVRAVCLNIIFPSFGVKGLVNQKVGYVLFDIKLSIIIIIIIIIITINQSGGVHHWLKRKSTREERKPVTRNNNNIKKYSLHAVNSLIF
jgi:uncharacterized membrane protein